ncbi:MAG: helix-turn-helix transcriptional regulator [Candidatus Gastranaerophilales bacterium]|nr:helix-turn-helix transcriptional regulator [Candidatus Gastranaerophilales bacterium]
MSNKNESLVKLGEQIKKLRKEKTFSQIKLALLLGISKEHLSKIERGATAPSINLLLEILKITGGHFIIQ